MKKNIFLCLSLLFTNFVELDDNTLILNAEEENSILDYFLDLFKCNDEENFIDEFVTEEKTLNSSLHPHLDSYDTNELYYVNNVNLEPYESYGDSNIWPEKQFEDIMYDYGSPSASDRVIENEDGTIEYINNFIGYNSGYYVYDKYQKLCTNLYGYEYVGPYVESGHNYSSPFKPGFASNNGISLISNDIYINSNFNFTDRIDIALVNESGYSIDYLNLLNQLSYISVNYQYQFPLIRVDGVERVNVILNGSNAYIVTHNCNFKFTEDGKNFYLSLPNTESIEKIAITIPFFTGGMGKEPYTRMDKNLNMYCAKYLAGENVREEIYSVMTGFKPYLWNDNINNDSEEFVEFCPYKIDSIDIDENVMYFRSIIPMNVSKITFDFEKKGLIEYLLKLNTLF